MQLLVGSHHTHWQGSIHSRRFALHPRTDIQEQNTQTPPRQARHHTSINDIPPRIRQAFHQCHNRSNTRRDTPTNDTTLARRMQQSHTVHGRQEEVVPLCTIFTRNQCKGSCDYERTEFLLKAFVAFDVSEPQARHNISTYVESVCEDIIIYTKNGDFTAVFLQMTHLNCKFVRGTAPGMNGSLAIGKTLPMALVRTYSTPPVPQIEPLQTQAKKTGMR